MRVETERGDKESSSLAPSYPVNHLFDQQTHSLTKQDVLKPELVCLRVSIVDNGNAKDIDKSCNDATINRTMGLLMCDDVTQMFFPRQLQKCILGLTLGMEIGGPGSLPGASTVSGVTLLLPI